MNPRIERAILLITVHFRDALGLSRIAAGVGLSPFHFQRLFKSQIGQTPAAYLNRVRLEHAAHLLVVLPDASLLQIAIESGFTSAATFARAFRKYFGESASDFRRRKRLVENKDLEGCPLTLHALPTRMLRVERCSLDEDALSVGYARLAKRTRTATANALGNSAVGIFFDAPFHLDRKLCRHYLALESERSESDSDAFELPGGLYASLRVIGSIDALSAEVVRFKSERIDPSPYAIASTIAFERIVLPDDMNGFDYRQCAREVFIKVRRKNEPVL